MVKLWAGGRDMKSRNQYSAQSLLIQATALKAEGKYKAALQLLEKALVQYPHDKSLEALRRRIDLLYKVKGD